MTEAVPFKSEVVSFKDALKKRAVSQMFQEFKKCYPGERESRLQKMSEESVELCMGVLQDVLEGKETGGVRVEDAVALLRTNGVSEDIAKKLVRICIAEYEALIE